MRKYNDGDLSCISNSNDI